MSHWPAPPGPAIAADEALPAHTIISLGTRRRLSLDMDDRDWWPVADGIGRCLDDGADAPDGQELCSRILNAARLAGAVGPRGAARAARAFLGSQFGPLPFDIRFLKEGQISTVFAAQWSGPAGEEVTCLNVARDAAEASERIRMGAAVLRRLGGKSDAPVRVLHSGEVAYGDRRLAVVAVELLADAVELHCPGVSDDPRRLFVVERFVPTLEAGGAHTLKVEGAFLTSAASDAVRASIRAALNEMVLGTDPQLRFAETDVNAGDWVVHDGRVRLVGLPELSPPLDRDEVRRRLDIFGPRPAGQGGESLWDAGHG